MLCLVGITSTVLLKQQYKSRFIIGPFGALHIRENHVWRLLTILCSPKGSSLIELFEDNEMLRVVENSPKFFCRCDFLKSTRNDSGTKPLKGSHIGIECRVIFQDGSCLAIILAHGYFFKQQMLNAKICLS